MSQNRPYQGYPYVNPAVIDVPSVDPETAARWSNLPRRPIRYAPTRPSETHRPSNRPKTDDTSGQDSTETTSVDQVSPETRRREEDNPVIYIDIPDSCSSSVVESPRNETANEQSEISIVQDTILYDPFKDRRIDMHTRHSRSDDSDSSTSEEREIPRGHVPSNTQQPSQGSSSGITLSPTFDSSTSSNLPAFMSKEAGYYARQPPDDGFLLAPIPVADFPEPPPAYTEIDVQANGPSPPRTEVVTTVTDPNSIVRPGSERKFLQCQHCSQRVHSLVVRENGAFTHIMALLVAVLFLIPLVILIYCTDCCKYKNHYCPNCNKLIGYEIPILCQKMAFA